MDKTNKKTLEEIIRVDHAGERGAIKIYEGQLLALKTFMKNDELKEKITTLAIIAHKAIGARDYSLFDFRIDNRTNEIIFLEAGLFWSFSKTSIISKMLFSGGDDVVKLIDQVWTYALPNNQ